MPLVHLGIPRFPSQGPAERPGPARPTGAGPQRAAGPAATGALRPACAWCRRVQAQDGSWVQPTGELLADGGALLTHVLCADCLDRHFGE